MRRPALGAALGLAPARTAARIARILHTAAGAGRKAGQSVAAPRASRGHSLPPLPPLQPAARTRISALVRIRSRWRAGRAFGRAIGQPAARPAAPPRPTPFGPSPSILVSPTAPMFYSSELLSRKSPLGAVWCVWSRFGGGRGRGGAWLGGGPRDACAGLTRGAACGPDGKRVIRGAGTPTQTPLLESLRLLAHGRKLNRPKIMSVNVVETW